MAEQIHAQFSLEETARVRCYTRSDDSTAQNPWIQVEGCRARLSPVQGEPFGSATPSGSLEMVIANPEAAKMFLDAPLGQKYDVLISPVEPAE